MRSQLLEEELRHRDRDAALLALDRDVERCRTYLDLSPDEALAQAKKAPAADKKLLEQLATTGWGAAQMYFRLSPDEMAELRAGRALVFGSNVTPDPLGRPRFDGRRTADALDFVLRPLPPEIARGTLQSLRDWRVNETNGVAQFGPAQDVPNGVPVTSWSGARPAVILLLRQDEQGQYTLYASAGLAFGPDETRYKLYGGDPLAVGLSPSVARPDNRVANAGLAHDPALQRVVTVEPQASCGGFRSPALASLLRRVPNPPQSGAEASDMTPRKVTTADVLEALHRATGMNLAADYYTRLYPAASVTLRSVKLFDALNQLADTMRMRWSKEGNWVRFRTIAFYNDRLKEVPNRLLERWAASRKQHGALTLDDLIEIAQLSDAQLDSRETGEGAWLCSGLEEWFLASHPLRYHLRFLGGLSPAQRRQAQTDAGLPFTQMSLPQQQQFLALAVEKDDLQKLRLADLAGPRLQVRYTPSGEFQWRRPPAANNPPLPSLVHERTREAALAAARRIDPRADVTQIVPADMNLVFLYTMSEAQNRRVAFR